jgi:hypothetical protein
LIVQGLELFAKGVVDLLQFVHLLVVDVNDLLEMLLPFLPSAEEVLAAAAGRVFVALGRVAFVEGPDFVCGEEVALWLGVGFVLGVVAALGTIAAGSAAVMLPGVRHASKIIF